MAAIKGVVTPADYAFNAAAKTVTFSATYTGLALSDIMYITNVKSGVNTIIYDPFDTTKAGSLAGLVLTLVYDTTAMSNGDSLQIIVSSQQSNGLTNAELRATAVPISVASLPLPAGASTAANQTTGNTSLSSIDGKLTNPLPVSGTVSAVVSGTVAVSNFPATQPISAAALPLPSGASTSALQTQPGVDIGDVTINNASGAAAVNIQDGGNSITVDVASLPLPAGAATEATQLLVKADVDKIPSQGQAVMAASMPVVIASNQTTIPISVASLPLPSNAAIETGGNLATIAAADVLSAASLSVMDDWDESDRAKVNPIAGQAGVDGGSGAVSAKTQRVILATDQAAVPVTFSGSPATDNTSLYSNTLAVSGAITGIDTTGYASIVFEFSGSWSGAILVEGCNDNSSFLPLFVLNTNEVSSQDIIRGNGDYVIKTTTKYVRLNVLQVYAGTITALILGRTSSGISGADLLSMAMDRANNSPMYVEETATKKDRSNALIPSDAPESIYKWAQATSAVIFQVDTTGYQSLVVQGMTIGSPITIQTSNDGGTWATLLGYSSASSTPTGTISSAGLYMYPATGKFARGLMAGANFTSVLVLLRQQPVTAIPATTGLPVNIAAVAGGAMLNAGNTGATGVAGSTAGVVPVGAPTGNNAPGSTIVPFPIIIGGREAASDGALAGKVRTILTDTLGKTIVTGDIGVGSSNQNIKSVAVQDISQYEGQSFLELLSNILIELRMNNQYIYELPGTLQRLLNDTTKQQVGFFDEPAVLRNDFSSLQNLQ